MFEQKSNLSIRFKFKKNKHNTVIVRIKWTLIFGVGDIILENFEQFIIIKIYSPQVYVWNAWGCLLIDDLNEYLGAFWFASASLCYGDSNKYGLLLLIMLFLISLHKFGWKIAINFLEIALLSNHLCCNLPVIYLQSTLV